VKLPIELTNASFASGAYSAEFSADGIGLTLAIRTGSAPSARDLSALKAIAASIRFPPLRVGHLGPDGAYVLARTSAYPLGSVTEVPAGLPLRYHTFRSGRFYLEHTKDGFWTITWPDDYLHGYKACGPHYDAARHRFTCPNGAVWDLEGKVVTNPNPKEHPDDPLQREIASVADGYVLVSLPSPP
jgi:hypothetical protein